MQRLNLKRRDPAEAVQLLAGHYIRLLRWVEAEKPVFVRIGLTPAHPQLLSATLVLNRNLQPIRQTLRVRARGEVHELRFEVVDYEREPAASVPDTTFNPENEQLLAPRRARRPSTGRPLDQVGIGNAQLAELQIGVLYQLHALHADTGVPIEVLRTADNEVLASYTLAYSFDYGSTSICLTIDSRLSTITLLPRVERLLWQNRHNNARICSRARWTCSSCEPCFMELLMATRSESTFSGPQTISCRCSTALSIPHCIA